MDQFQGEAGGRNKYRLRVWKRAVQWTTDQWSLVELSAVECSSCGGVAKGIHPKKKALSFRTLSKRGRGGWYFVT